MRRRKRIGRSHAARLLCIVLMAVGAPCASFDRAPSQSDKGGKSVPVAGAEKRIGAHITYIEKRVGGDGRSFLLLRSKKNA